VVRVASWWWSGVGCGEVGWCGGVDGWWGEVDRCVVWRGAVVK
jgi:hypothetical protein